MAVAAAAICVPAALGAADWHVGPFFERDTVRDFWAVRPFYSQEPGVKDVLWPLGTWHAAGSSNCWWRALVAYGHERSFNVFPLWFSGREREADDAFHWALFPVWGRHPHLLTLEDWHFALWPIYMDYATPCRDDARAVGASAPRVRSHAVLWPIVSWKDEPRPAFGLWPLFGWSRRRESNHAYALWPIATWARYDEDRDTAGAGASFMVWPLFGGVRRARETQDLLLPPFFSFAQTDGGRGSVAPSGGGGPRRNRTSRLRCPWPFVDWERGPSRDRLSIWPFWESVDGYAFGTGAHEESTWRVGWKLVESTTLATSVSREERFSVFPFWTRERDFRHDAADPVSEYLRIWPFYASHRHGDRRETKVLDLLPIRHSGGFARNWDPFFTLYSSRTRADGRTRHSLLWNLVTWHTGEKRAKGADR